VIDASYKEICVISIYSRVCYDERSYNERML